MEFATREQTIKSVGGLNIFLRSWQPKGRPRSQFSGADLKLRGGRSRNKGIAQLLCSLGHGGEAADSKTFFVSSVADIDVVLSET